MVPPLTGDGKSLPGDGVRREVVIRVEPAPGARNRVEYERAVLPVASVGVASEQDEASAPGVEAASPVLLSVKPDFVVGPLPVEYHPAVGLQLLQHGVEARRTLRTCLSTQQ